VTGLAVDRRARWAGAAVALVLLICLAQVGPGRAAADGLFRDPEKSFTELYFPDPSGLPRKAIPGSPLEFSFVITNRTNERQSYAWRAFATVGTETVAGPRGTAVLQPGTTTRTGASVRIPTTAARASVTVALPAQNERISFWVKQDATTGVDPQ
jgi:hypothetical protein